MCSEYDVETHQIFSLVACLCARPLVRGRGRSEHFGLCMYVCMYVCDVHNTHCDDRVVFADKAA